nr:MerR family transcriptional regulator [uncultured Niameybacter sp.]
MDRHFSIGEVSKLHNVSIQTLRHYDKIGLLKPAFVNETSKYRYYSLKHFIMLDFIKQCKAMGLTLDEIKELVSHHTSLEAILETLSKQKEIIAMKIQELESIQTHIGILENKIQTVLEDGINHVVIKSSEERRFLKYNNTRRFTEEFEIKLIKTLREIEKKYGTSHKELAFSIPYKKFEEKKELTYDHMMINCGTIHEIDGQEEVILPKGNYLTIHFDDDFKDTSPYYEKLLDYIKEHKLEVDENFYESYIITRVDINDGEKSLGQIQIRILENK